MPGTSWASKPHAQRQSTAVSLKQRALGRDSGVQIVAQRLGVRSANACWGAAAGGGGGAMQQTNPKISAGEAGAGPGGAVMARRLPWSSPREPGCPAYPAPSSCTPTRSSTYAAPRTGSFPETRLGYPCSLSSLEI